MVEEESVVLRGPGAEEIKLSGHIAGVEREVLAYKIGQARDDILFSEDGFLYRRQFFVNAGVVDQIRIVSAKVELDGAMILGFDFFEERPHTGNNLMIEVIVMSAHGALQQDFGGDHVEARNSSLPSLIVVRPPKCYPAAWETKSVCLRHGNVGKHCLAFETAALLSLTMSLEGRARSARVVGW